MSFYPKQLTGPSSLGTGQARALEARGGDFQWSQRDSSTVVKKQGDFRKVITGGFEYVTEGRWRITGSFEPRTCLRYITPFIPGFSLPGIVNTGEGIYFLYRASAFVDPGQTYTYNYPGGRQATYLSRLRSRSVQGTLVGFYGQTVNMGSIAYQISEYAGSSVGEYVALRALAPTGHYLRKETETGKQVFSVASVPGSRVDSASRPLCDVGVIVWNQREPYEGFALNTSGFTRANAEFIGFFPTVVTQNYVAFFAAEIFFWPEIYSAGKNYAPKAFLFVANAKDIYALAAYEVTTTVFPDPWLPPPTAGNPLVPGLEADFYPPTDPAIRLLNNMNTVSMADARIAVLPGDVALIAMTVFVKDVSAPNGFAYRWRILRLSLPALTLSAVANEPVTEGYPRDPGPDMRRHVTDLVHLGAGWVIMRDTYGYQGVDFDIVFRLSTDGGFTWTDLAPEGLEAPLLNQYFGAITVHKPRTGNLPDEAGIILMNSWSEAEQAVFVFESRDDGNTWERRGKVVKPDAFYRIDQMLAGDGGGNFELLLPGPDPLRLADLTITDRYTQ